MMATERRWRKMGKTWFGKIWQVEWIKGRPRIQILWFVWQLLTYISGSRTVTSIRPKVKEVATYWCWCSGPNMCGIWKAGGGSVYLCRTGSGGISCSGGALISFLGPQIERMKSNLWHFGLQSSWQSCARFCKDTDWMLWSHYLVHFCNCFLCHLISRRVWDLIPQNFWLLLMPQEMPFGRGGWYCLRIAPGSITSGNNWQYCYTGWFFYWYPPKSSKYKKVNLG